MEKNVLPSPEVLRELKDFVAVELFTDGGSAQDKANQKLLLSLAQTTANPTYVVVNPDGKPVKRLEGLHSIPEFAQFLKDARVAALDSSTQMAQR
jgi:hypothetical protein